MLNEVPLNKQICYMSANCSWPQVPLYVAKVHVAEDLIKQFCFMDFAKIMEKELIKRIANCEILVALC